jgi:glycosyltransferase involved in cell wall biosynthesis
MATQLFSIVLPVHNQADHIAETVAGTSAQLSSANFAFEMLLVVNGCSDASLDVCTALAANGSGIRVLRSERGGWGLAVRAGLAEARGDVVCYTNSARTVPRDLLLMLLYSAANPGTVVKANRRVRESWRRRLGSLLYNLQCRALLDLAYWDINGTPKVFPRTFSKLLQLSRDDDLIDLEFLMVCRREGYPVLEVPLLSARRHGGASTTGYRTAVRLYLGAYRMWRQARIARDEGGR